MRKTGFTEEIMLDREFASSGKWSKKQDSVTLISLKAGKISIQYYNIGPI